MQNGGCFSLTTAYFDIAAGQKLVNYGVVSDYCLFEMYENKNIDNLLLLKKDINCLRESREDRELELKLANKLLEI